MCTHLREVRDKSAIHHNVKFCRRRRRSSRPLSTLALQSARAQVAEEERIQDLVVDKVFKKMQCKYISLPMD